MMIMAMSEIVLLIISGLHESNDLGILLVAWCLRLALIMEHKKAHGLPWPWPRPFHHLDRGRGARKANREEDTASQSNAYVWGVWLAQRRRQRPPKSRSSWKGNSSIHVLLSVVDEGQWLLIKEKGRENGWHDGPRDHECLPLKMALMQ